jgi:hypothetical protein
MFKFFELIRRYSFLLIIFWIALFALDLIDDLHNNYSRRPSSEVAWMLFADLLRFFVVIGIWVASNFQPHGKNEEQVT